MKLKKRYIVVLLRNLRPNKGSVKGARYVIENMTDNVLHLKSVTGALKGEHLALPKVKADLAMTTFQSLASHAGNFRFERAFAMTKNNSQSQSVRGRLGIDLTDSCFSHGQFCIFSVKAMIFLGLQRI